MVARELERDMARLAAKTTNDRFMLRALECFDQGICFVDTEPEEWQAMHSNAVLTEVRTSRALRCALKILGQRACTLCCTLCVEEGHCRWSFSLITPSLRTRISIVHATPTRL